MAADYQRFLLRSTENLNILRQREAKYGGAAPLALLNQMADHEQAIALTALDRGQHRHDSVPLLLARSLAQVSETARQVLGVVGLLSLAPFSRESIAAALGLDGRRANPPTPR